MYMAEIYDVAQAQAPQQAMQQSNPAEYYRQFGSTVPGETVTPYKTGPSLAAPNLGPPLPEPQESSSMLPTVLAVLAAARGNIGPLFELQEQKRKTAIYKSIGPQLARFNELADSGKLDEAANLMGQVFSQYGARAPELGQFIQPRLQALESLRQQMGDIKALSRLQELTIQSREAKGLPVPDTAKINLKALKEAANSPKMARMIAEQVKLSRPEQWMSPGGTAVVQSYPTTGEVVSTPIPQHFGDKDITPFVARELANDPQLRAANGGKPLLRPDVINILNTGKPEERELISNRVAAAQLAEQQFDFGKAVHYDPSFTAGALLALQKTGLNAADAVKAFTSGNMPANVIAEGINNAHMLKLSEAMGQGRGATLALQMVPPVLWGKDMTMYDPRTRSENTQLSFDQGVSQGMAVFDRATLNKVKELDSYSLRLMTLGKYLEKLPKQNDTLDRAATGLAKTLNRVLNVDADLSAQEAVETFVGQVIEKYENVTGAKSSAMANVKSKVAGGKVTVESAVKVVNEVLNHMEQQHDTYVRQNSVTEVPKPQLTVPQESKQSTTQGKPLPEGTIDLGNGLTKRKR
jgi:hypothetical protein